MDKTERQAGSKTANAAPGLFTGADSLAPSIPENSGSAGR